MADLAGGAVRTSKRLPGEDYTAADTGAERNADRIVVFTRGADPMLADRSRRRIVLKDDREPETRSK